MAVMRSRPPSRRVVSTGERRPVAPLLTVVGAIIAEAPLERFVDAPKMLQLESIHVPRMEFC